MAQLFDRIRIHYSAYYSGRIEYEQNIQYSPTHTKKTAKQQLTKSILRNWYLHCSKRQAWLLRNEYSTVLNGGKKIDD